MLFTDFKNALASHIFNLGESTLPEKYYLGLTTVSELSADGSNVVEPSATSGYSRKELPTFTVPVNGAVQNNAVIDFGEVTEDWGVVRYAVFYGQADGGTPLFAFPLTTPLTVSAEEVFRFKTGGLRLNIGDLS